MTKPKYRLLRKGERLRIGDEITFQGKWYKTVCAGSKVCGPVDLFTYRRRIRKGEK